MGKRWGRLGRSNATVECHSSVLFTIKGPSNCGMNFSTWFKPPALISHHKWSVDKMTWSLTLNGKERDWVLLA